jgi:4-carboxymuconolactone decarboxylase
MSGLSDDEITSVVSDRADLLAPEEQLLLRLADAMAATPTDVSDELFAALRAHFSEEALIELAADAAQENYRARWNRVFDVGSDELYCAIPPRAGV